MLLLCRFGARRHADNDDDDVYDNDGVVVADATADDIGTGNGGTARICGGNSGRGRGARGVYGDGCVVNVIDGVGGGGGSNALRNANQRMSMMSCVRENSPPLDLDGGLMSSASSSGPMSLPIGALDCSSGGGGGGNFSPDGGGSLRGGNLVTSTPLAAGGQQPDGSSGASAQDANGSSTTAEQQKRRRFHPLRNLRRIFRRRTINTTTTTSTTPTSSSSGGTNNNNNNNNDSGGNNTISGSSTSGGPCTSSTSEKNLRSATLSSISSVVSASSPSSPLTHQQLQEAYSSQSLPKSKSYSVTGKTHRDALLAQALHANNNRYHQQQQQLQHYQPTGELGEVYQYGNSNQNNNNNSNSNNMYSTTTTASATSYHHQRQSMGVAVLPTNAMNRNFYMERQKLRSVGDSSQELDTSSSGGGCASTNATGTGAGAGAGASGTSRGSSSEMSDSQRSLSEGRLLDSDYARDQLSQSHDSVFSESATASSLSIVLKAELADVLRKRRNRPDASDEDLGLPSSPASPQRRADHQQHHNSNHNSSSQSSSSNATTTTTTTHKYSNNNNTTTNSSNLTTSNQSEVSSLSLLSMNSTDGEDLDATTPPLQQQQSQPPYSHSRYARSMTLAALANANGDAQAMRHSLSGGTTFSSMDTPSTTAKQATVKTTHKSNSLDEVDLFSSNWQRLSHSAAKHKMAIRPMKKKGGPSRQHRRTLENSIPEANEDILRVHTTEVLEDAKTRTRSLPPGVNAKVLQQHAAADELLTKKHTASKTTNHTSNNNNITATTTTTTTTSTTEKKITNTNTNTNKHTTQTSSGGSIFGFRRTQTPKENNNSSADDSLPSNSNAKRKEHVSSTKLTSGSANNSTTAETTESGFLRLFMTRNSKRSLAKANASSDDADGNANTNASSTTDDFDIQQNEPKKLQISNSCYEQQVVEALSTPAPSNTVLVKSRSTITCNEPSVEEKRRELKREIQAEGKSGLSALLNNFMLPSGNSASTSGQEKVSPMKESQPAATNKPKSGPAARQRYLPQDIASTLERKQQQQTQQTPMSTTTTLPALVNESLSSGSLLTAKSSSNSETFQSTSIIREITANQATQQSVSAGNSSVNITLPSLMSTSLTTPSASSATATATVNASAMNGKLSDHHFEKKPKIVGLSTFQQKISRSNDSFGRHTSNTSLEAAELLYVGFGDATAKKKTGKPVEKSRSFRTYQENSGSSMTTGSGMSSGDVTSPGTPSLPDLSMNLRVPACFSNFLLNDKAPSYSPPSPPESHDKSVSLGFEINDNTLVKPAPRAESTNSLLMNSSAMNANRSVILTTTTAGTNGKAIAPSKALLSPATVVPHLSPSNSCNKNISEIEQNIDLIVKSPFISVLRKSATVNEELGTPRLEEKCVSVRPTVLHLRDTTSTSNHNSRNNSSEQLSVVTTPPTPSIPSTFTTAPTVVQLRDKSNTTSITINKTPGRDGERKSVPTLLTSTALPPPATSAVTNGNSKLPSTINSSKTPRRSSATVMESDGGGVINSSAMTTTGKSSVPEFMKIQLNRVDPARITKGNVVVLLAKNVKDIPKDQQRAESKSVEDLSKSSSSDDICMRRYSNESVDINERDSPLESPVVVTPGEQQRRISGIFEAINKQTKVIISSNATAKCESPVQSPLQSPQKSQSPTKPQYQTSSSTTPSPSSPTSTTTPKSPSKILPNLTSTNESTETVELRVKPAESLITSAATLSNNKLSLLERKRIFMTEERVKTDKRIEELRQERKKSLNDELYRKSSYTSNKSEVEKIPSHEEPTATSTTTTTQSSERDSPQTDNGVVVLRKKSFALNTNTNTNSNIIISNNNNNGNSSGSGREDATPELMKVFARRSLKVKEEDINVLSDKIAMVSNTNYSSATLKRLGGGGSSNGNGNSNASGSSNGTPTKTPLQQSVDSDKENQSASDEKLDKMANTIGSNEHLLLLSNGSGIVKTNGIGVGNGSGGTTVPSNRNSLADFRIGSTTGNGSLGYKNGTSIANGFALGKCNHSNNNNNGNLPNGGKNTLPPIKVGSLRGTNSSTASKLLSSSERHEALYHNNNNNNFNMKGNHTLERQTISGGSGGGSSALKKSALESDDDDRMTSKTIERSATVGEFKGIHQRRAEWEQRAKEALK